MKTLYVKALGVVLTAGAMTACGDGFLDAKQYNAVDIDSGLNTVTNIGYAVNGEYYRLFYYYFAGNYATMIGDIASDISYWNTETGHFNNLYQFTPTVTETYLRYIWEWGYKVVDNSARVIKAGKALESQVTGSELAQLQEYMAEAYALRAYANLAMVNVFAHQVKVDGKDYSSELGLVVVEEPISANDKVSRGTVGQTYELILGDLAKSIDYFNKCGMDQGVDTYFTPKAVYGLLSRANLYLEKWDDVITNAKKALELSGIDELAYTAEAYKQLYNGGGSNTESMFYLDITSTTNWSANSCGTLWSTYNYSPSPYLKSLMADGDVRTSVWAMAATSTATHPVMKDGGKFGAYASGNPAYATNYLVNAPEMYLNLAEAYLAKKQTTDAQDALLVVAKRNPAIKSVADLPATEADLKSFLQDERARELFQEGFRLWDLRRWNKVCNVYATNAPEISAFIQNVQLGNLVFPIPEVEINTKAGVVQNEGWSDSLPKQNLKE